MIRPELRAFDFSDVDPKTGRGLDDPEYFGTPMLCLVAPSDAPRSLQGHPVGEWFDVFACTPKWLAENMPERGYLWGQHMLIVPRWDEALLERAVEDLLGHVAAHAERLAGDADKVDWGLISEMLSRVTQWEYGGHNPLLPNWE
ncbi:MAG TPA: Imm8 family immunity protein [Thermomicrobiales bacterium]|jgi:hypothetical protein